MVILGCFFFVVYHITGKKYGVPWKDPRRCTHALYMLCILIVSCTCTGGKWIQRKMEILKIGYSKTFPVGPREIGIWTPWSMKDPATFPRKVVFLRTFTDIKMGCPNGPGAFNSMVIWKQALDFSLSKYLQVFPMNILVGSLESWHEHTHNKWFIVISIKHNFWWVWNFGYLSGSFWLICHLWWFESYPTNQ